MNDAAVARVHRACVVAHALAMRLVIMGACACAIGSRYWVRGVRGVAHSGIFIGPCFWNDDSDAVAADASSLARFAREIKASFSSFADDGDVARGRCARSAVGSFLGCALDARMGNVGLARAGQACVAAYAWFLMLESVCVVYYTMTRRSRGLMVSSVSQMVYGTTACATGASGSIALARAFRSVAKDARAVSGDVDGVALRDILGWGFWLFVSCVCASAVMLAASAVEFRAGVARRDSHDEGDGADDVRGGPSAPPFLSSMSSP